MCQINALYCNTVLILNVKSQDKQSLALNEKEYIYLILIDYDCNIIVSIYNEIN